MNMKKFFYIVLLSLWFYPCFAQQRAVERIYISTDRTFYVAGERIWLSLYCFDLSQNERRFSGVSNVAYVELRNDSSLVSSAKLRIDRGRGSGVLTIPRALPTGNYRLIAYTKQMLNEEELAAFDRVIPIFNTLTVERLPEGVLFEDKDGEPTEPNAALPLSDSRHIEVKLGHHQQVVPPNHSLPLSLKNVSGEAITFSLSIARTEPPMAQNPSLQEFFTHNQPGSTRRSLQERYIPEFEGEVIRGRITNIQNITSKERLIFLSAVGTELIIYDSSVDPKTGEFTFFTNSLYGNREIALEYSTSDEVSYELYDPFIKPPVQPVPPLHLDTRYKLLLSQRSVGMQISHRFEVDTLYERVAVWDDPFTYNYKPLVYLLDDYTRFPTMQDIVMEYVTEMKFRRINGQPSFQIFLLDWGKAFMDNTLVMIDGIAILDQERLVQYDPLKVKSLSIYPYRYRVGNSIFNGIAKVDTYTGKYPGLTLGKNALIIDYQGVQLPSRFTGKFLETSDNFPDVRTLLYWDPLLELTTGAHQEINLKTSSIPGEYTIVLEGVTTSGIPICFRSEFRVE